MAIGTTRSEDKIPSLNYPCIEHFVHIASCAAGVARDKLLFFSWCVSLCFLLLPCGPTTLSFLISSANSVVSKLSFVR